MFSVKENLKLEMTFVTTTESSAQLHKIRKKKGDRGILQLLVHSDPVSTRCLGVRHEDRDQWPLLVLHLGTGLPLVPP